MSFNPASSRFHELEVEAADRDAARIAARRARMAERTDRLLDARSRTVGMDYAALEAQIAEKQRAEAARKAAERAEVEETARHMALAKAVEEETRSHKAAAAAAASAALTEQAASRSLRTTGDLEGWRRADDAGMRIREDRDARGLDPDPRLGPGSAQVFDGEDPHRPDRIRLQRAQVAAWAEEAAAERAARAAEAAEAARASHAALRETVQYAEALEDASAEARRRRAAGMAADNLRAAEARRAVEAAAAAEGRAAEAASLLTTTQRGAGELRGDDCCCEARGGGICCACLECEAGAWAGRLLVALAAGLCFFWGQERWAAYELIPLPHPQQQSECSVQSPVALSSPTLPRTHSPAHLSPALQTRGRATTFWLVICPIAWPPSQTPAFAWTTTEACPRRRRTRRGLWWRDRWRTSAARRRASGRRPRGSTRSSSGACRRLLRAAWRRLLAFRSSCKRYAAALQLPYGRNVLRGVMPPLRHETCDGPPCLNSNITPSFLPFSVCCSIAAQAARLERATAAAKDAAKREAVAVLERQVAEAAERRRQEAAERRGVRIGDEFYGRFGTSDR